MAKSIRLKEADSDVRLVTEMVAPRCEPCDYKLHARIESDDGMLGQLVLSRRQALKLRDWITMLEMYGGN